MSKAPKLRFKEFSGDWKEKKFNTIFLDIKNKTSDTVKYPLYSLTIENGVVPKSERYEREFLVTKDEDNFKVVNKNEFVYNPMNLRFGALARYKGDTSVSVSGYYNVFKVIDNSPESFWDNYLKTNRMMYIYNTIATGSLIEKRRVHFTQFIELKLPVPSQKEQEKIASFFSLIDDKISLQGEKVEALKDYKKGMMQKIFRRELRFKDDDGRDYPEWEEKKLGEIANITMGQSPSSACYNEEYIGLPLIQGNADVKDRKTEPRVYTSEITKTCDIGDIIMSVRAPVGAISMSLHNACIGRGVCSIKPRYNVEYVYQFLLKYESKWSQVSQGSTFESVNSNDIKSLKILFPNLDEQNKIGNFLKNIDKRIEKEQEKLDSLNEYKKGLLQQMFV